MSKVFVVADDYYIVRGVYRTASGMLEAVTKILEGEGWDTNEWDGMTAAKYAEDRYGQFLSTSKNKHQVEYFDIDYCVVSICELE